QLLYFRGGIHHDMGTQWSKAIHGTPDYPVGDEMQELFESLGFTVYDMNNIYVLFNAINQGT
ncbi:hypothetical protein DYB25_009100, partial [Aphanomyces astaci]